nr:hypothetical protein [Streptococcus pneumoniae]
MIFRWAKATDSTGTCINK